VHRRSGRYHHEQYWKSSSPPASAHGTKSAVADGGVVHCAVQCHRLVCLSSTSGIVQEPIALCSPPVAKSTTRATAMTELVRRVDGAVSILPTPPTAILLAAVQVEERALWCCYSF